MQDDSERDWSNTLTVSEPAEKRSECGYMMNAYILKDLISLGLLLSIILSSFSESCQWAMHWHAGGRKAPVVCVYY